MAGKEVQRDAMHTEYVVYNDPVHGTIEIHPLLNKMINTPEFNRLKNIKQLSGKYYVYPGATHTRFEHSIGVCHVAGEFVRMLQRNQTKQLGITPKEVLCVKMAGLCHDLGHGPFSHLFEQSVMHKEQVEAWCTTPGKWEHEDLSKQVLQRIYDREKRWFDDDSFTQSDIDVVKRMIHHKAEDIKEVPRRFLYEIVANDQTGLDVDKWDYFERDCHYIGMSNPFDWRRCMKLSRVIERSICFRDKELGNICDMFRIRSYLHSHAYQHKTGDAVDHMIAEAIRLAAVSGAKLLYVNKASKSIKEAVSEARDKKDLDGFLALTDSILQLILNANPETTKYEHSVTATDEESKQSLEKAQTLLRKLDKREIFRVLLTQPWEPYCAGLKEELKTIATDTGIDASDLFMKQVDISYGAKDKDPVEQVQFYSKHKPDTIVPRSEIELMTPDLSTQHGTFQEKQLRVYWMKEADTESKKSEIKERVEKALRKLKTAHDAAQS